MKKEYNVIWIDDEWEKQQEFKEECEDLGIHLQGYSYQKAGMDELDKHPNLWDAVILDGEIKDKSDHEEPSTKGLLNALMHLASLPANRQIPRFISTGKDKVKDNEMLKDEIIYIKDIDDEKLIDDIRKTIDNIEKFKVKILYKEIIDFLGRINQEISDSIICIFEKMHYPDSNESFDSKLYYNQIRQAMECIFIEANKKGVIPDECFSSGRPIIDQCYRYLVGDPAYHAGVRYGQQGEKVVPEYIEDMMSMIKNLGNEFSHPNENKKTHYLLFSLALNLYEIAVWMYQYFENHPNKEDNLLKCKQIRKDDGKCDSLKGKINKERTRVHFSSNYIIDKSHGFMGNNTPIEYEYKENEEVLFELRKTINPKTGLPFSFAQNVRPIKNPLDNNINR